MYIWVALKENVASAKILWRTTEICSHAGFLLEPVKIYLMQRQYLLRPMTWKVTRTKCVERYCEFANKTSRQLHKVATPCMDDHQFKEEEETESVGDLSTVCSQIVLKCLYLARIGRLDILWSVNKLVRAVMKWTKTCDKRLERLISYIHHTSEYRQCCNVGNSAQHCKLGLFQGSDFAGDLEDSKSTSGGILCIFGRHTFVPRSWMCKKQTSVSHSSTVAEIISLDAALRMDGIPALTLWDLVIEVFHSVPNRIDGPKREPRWNPSAIVKPNMHNAIPTKHTNVIPTNIDHISTKYDAFWFQCYVVCLWGQWGSNQNDYQRSKSHNEACFTDLQSCSGLVVWQDQIIYIDTKHQLAEILTIGNFSRDEWNNLLHLFNISHFSSNCCTKNFSLISFSTVAKRIRNQKEEDRVVSKSRPAAMNLSSFIATSSSTASSPIASKGLGMPIASGETRQQDKHWPKLIRRSVDFSSATKGCILWRVNGKAAGKPVASRRRRFRRLRQSWGWDLVLQRETSYGENCCPIQ